MSGGIQSQITTQPAPGIPGDFASANPRFAANFGAGGAVAGPNGLVVNLACWASYSQIDGDGAPCALNNFGSGNITGIAGRLEQGLITTYLSNAGVTIPAGVQASAFTGGDFWVKNNGAGQAQSGMKAYASFTTGQFTFAAPGAPTTASATSSSIATGTAATFTGSISNDVLTVTGSVTNTIYPGAILSGSGVATNTVITSQLSGATGGAGTYSLSIPEQSVASESLTATPYVLDTTGGTVTGSIVQGSVISSAGGTATGTVVGMSVATVNQPATGKYIVAPVANIAPGTVTSGTIVLASNVETSFYAVSSALAGESVKISNNPGVTH
ncbi:hypothetical protein IC762_17735 [Bradyrhizobium genosp. L]|uniref:structural cement protein Gp24 n=1 Tax=Bradyrhizobium genosp. L TaxID=83637 RepID=UPI0018A322B7|nr:hypothetical protein [Bradyrhizobium genosp. L]QPF81666.1 hypothetical protein IC762_17735 [Bradyrhizobium genosp. L]